MVPVLVGTAAARGVDGPLIAWRAVAAAVVALALQVATNFANDYSDGIRGTDDPGARVGPVRLVGWGLKEPKAVKKAAVGCFGVAGLVGLSLAVAVGPELIAVGAVSIAAGWFYTGDIGVLDATGRLTLSGRADDMFVFNSMNIYPQELEAVIREFPGVQAAAVFPRPSATHGAIPVALVESADPALDLKALRRFVQERVGLRCPRQFLRVHDIPRNSAGKIRREQLSAIAVSGSP